MHALEKPAHYIELTGPSEFEKTSAKSHLIRSLHPIQRVLLVQAIPGVDAELKGAAGACAARLEPHISLPLISQAIGVSIFRELPTAFAKYQARLGSAQPAITVDQGFQPFAMGFLIDAKIGVNISLEATEGAGFRNVCRRCEGFIIPVEHQAFSLFQKRSGDGC